VVVALCLQRQMDARFHGLVEDRVAIGREKDDALKIFKMAKEDWPGLD
jgi:hypothetical protein